MAKRQSEKAETFRALHRRPGAFVIPNPWDIGSARWLASLGFEALATTSAGFAFSMGRPDGGMTRDEHLAHARAIIGAIDLPVAADLENCYGDDPKIVAETIRLAGEAGLVGGSVEDASGDAARPIYDFSLALERVEAAVEAARALPFPFMLAARAENFLHGRPDLDDTLKRLQAFDKAGADVLYAPGLPNLEAVRTVCTAVSKPVNVLAGSNQSFTVDALAAAGVKRISLGSALYRAAFGGLERAAREIKEVGTFAFGKDATPFPVLNRFMAGSR